MYNVFPLVCHSWHVVVTFTFFDLNTKMRKPFAYSREKKKCSQQGVYHASIQLVDVVYHEFTVRLDDSNPFIIYTNYMHMTNVVIYVVQSFQ